MNTIKKLKFDSRKRKRVEACPCGKSNKDGKFVPYAEEEKYGYCHSCNETFLPKLTAEQKAVFRSKPKSTTYIPFSKIPFKVFNKYRELPIAKSAPLEDMYWKGDFSFCDFMIGLDRILVRNGNLLPQHFKQLLFRYQITPSGKNNGVVFWQIDYNFRIRNGKIMWYNPKTCKRKDGASTVAYQEKLKDFKHNSCFFGEHLLSLYPNAKIGLVESEKTALYMATIYPDMVWLATGGKHGANWTSRSVFFPLIGRKLMIFPDLDAHEEWSAKAKILQSAGVLTEVSDLLINTSNDFKNQYPTADIMDLGLIEKWHQKKANQRRDIINENWKIKPPKAGEEFILF